MKAIDAKILVQIQKGESATQKINGFEVPVGAGEYEVAKVLSVGPKVEGVSEGDTLYVYVNSGHDFTHDGQKYRTISIPDVIVVL